MVYFSCSSKGPLPAWRYCSSRIQFLSTPSLDIAAYLVRFPYKSGFFQPYQVVTAIFTHLHFLQLLFSMLALWFFGVTLERIWGPVRFLMFYLLCGIAGGLIAVFFDNNVGFGASGAIMGVLGAFAYLFPNMPLMIFPIPFPIKAKYLVMGIAALDLLGTFSQAGKGGGLGSLSQLGGLAMGLLVVIIWNKTNKRTFY
jgi:membrane associated rhomboid family serine protease